MPPAEPGSDLAALEEVQNAMVVYPVLEEDEVRYCCRFFLKECWICLFNYIMTFSIPREEIVDFVCKFFGKHLSIKIERGISSPTHEISTEF